MIVQWPWLIPAIATGLGLIMLMIRFPKVWLGIFMLSLPYFLTDSGKGISVTEVVFGGLFTLSIIIWMVRRLTFDSRRLVQGFTDFLLLFFIAAAAANVVVAQCNGIDLMGWATDWTYLLLMAYYFPLREEFGSDSRSFKIFLALSAITSVLMSAYSAYIFKQRMAENVAYAYQMFSSRSVTLGPLILLGLCISVVMIFHVDWRIKLATFVVVLANIAALLLTYTRTLWVFAFVGVMIVMLFLRFQQNVRLILATVVFAVVSMAAFYSVNPEIAKMAGRLVTKRFTSSADLSGGDHSFVVRMTELRTVWRQVEEAPLGGHGLRSQFTTWDTIVQSHHPTSFVHVGYVGLIFHLGFPTAMILFATLIGFSIRSFKTAVAARHPSTPPLVKALAIGVFAFIPAVYVNIFMAGIFDQRYGNVMFAFIFACIAITENFVVKARKDAATPQ